MIKKCLCAILVLVCSSSFSYAAAKNKKPTPNEIKHVVVLMLENRSFDNMLSWLYSKQDAPSSFIPFTTEHVYRGLGDISLDQYTNFVKNSRGEIVFSTPPIKGIPSVANSPFINSPQFDPNESFAYVTKQIYGTESNQPLMTGFLQDCASIWWEDEWEYQKPDICAVMETYTKRELPFLYSLARHYAVSDDWFSSVPTQTNPNRAFAACGTSDGQLVNGFLSQSQFQADTIWNRLYDESPTTSWTIFWQSDMVAGLIPGPFTGPNNFVAMNRIADLESHYQKIDSFHTRARNGDLPDFSFIEPEMSNMGNLTQFAVIEPIIGRGFLTGWQGNDMHAPSDLRTAENLVANIYTSLIANQKAWNHTLFVITFDEHGGMFDHVPPPAAIPPDAKQQNGFGFDRYGVRVPAIFISPLIQRKTVLRSNLPKIPFDHTSLIATIFKWKNIDKSKWNMGKRVDAAPTFETVLTHNTPRKDSIIFSNKDRTFTIDPANTVHVGDRFYLRDVDGNYLTKGAFCFEKVARWGDAANKVKLQCTAGSGLLSHGSFALIQSLDTNLGAASLLESSLIDGDCFYQKDSHTTEQWWTIKSVEHPHLGAPIHFGDRIYIENHIYMDVFQAVPSRLTKKKSVFGNLLTTKPITDQESKDHYWIVEKIEDNTMNQAQ